MSSVTPPAESLVTKDDLSETKGVLRHELAETKSELIAQIGDVKVQVARLETKIEASAKGTMRWMLMFFIPVWAGTWGTVVAVLLKH